MYCMISQVDVSTALAYVMAPKDDSELTVVKKACQATMDLFTKFLKEQIISIIDGEKVGLIVSNCSKNRRLNATRNVLLKGISAICYRHD